LQSVFFPCSKPCTLRRRVVLKQMDGRAVTVRETREEDDVKGRRKKEEEGSCNIRTHPPAIAPPSHPCKRLPIAAAIATPVAPLIIIVVVTQSQTPSFTIHPPPTTVSAALSFSAAPPTTCNQRHCTSALKKRKKKSSSRKGIRIAAGGDDG
jgi:hypothetical protein